MAGARSALIVATYEYDDPDLPDLRAPGHDADALAAVLKDPAIGGYQVQTVINNDAHNIQVAVGKCFQGRRSGNLLLLHFSCHGIKDQTGELYFAAKNTQRKLVEASAVPSSFVRKVMDGCGSRRIVLLLDCCFSGAFGRVTRDAGLLDVNDRLGGRGRAVITASSAVQTAADAESGPSPFTRALVTGLRTGEADRNLDGWISLDELYAYVHDEVLKANPGQEPTKSVQDAMGELYIAGRSSPVTTPSQLPPDIKQSLSSHDQYIRRGAVEALRQLLHGNHPGLALAARIELTKLAKKDDSHANRKAARKALGDQSTRRTPHGIAREVGDGEGEALDSTAGPDTTTTDTTDTSDLRPATDDTDAGHTLVLPATTIGRSGWSRWSGWSGWTRRRTVLAASAGIALVAGLLAWGRHTSASEPQLRDSELLVVVSERDIHSLIAVDADSGKLTLTVHTRYAADRPSISPDRDWMVYLTGPWNPKAPKTPHLARVDGSDDRLLLDLPAEPEKCR
jgi:hypothetical protein